LVTVTLLSMAMALSLSVVVWRMLREDRHRSDARVEALKTLASRREVRGPAAPMAGPSSSRPLHARPRPVLDLPLRPDGAAAPIAPPGGAAVPESLSSRGSLFIEPQRSSAWGLRAAIIAGLTLGVAAIILLALSSAARPATTRTTAVRGPVAQAAGAPALDLLSLRDSRDATSLTITGLVQNPAGGTALSRVSVTAFVFDAGGQFVASGRALLDVTALAPGDQSPFVVTVPAGANVARYRISFRGEDGKVIAHVDRRQQGTVAANW